MVKQSEKRFLTSLDACMNGKYEDYLSYAQSFMNGFDFYYEAEANDAVSTAYLKVKEFGDGNGERIMDTNADPHSLMLLAIKQFFITRKRAVSSRLKRENKWRFHNEVSREQNVHEGYESYDEEKSISEDDRAFLKAVMEQGVTVKDIVAAFGLKSNYEYYKRKERLLKKIERRRNTE